VYVDRMKATFSFLLHVTIGGIYHGKGQSFSTMGNVVF